ncbi:MAG: class I SAM-dependent methyltransferase [Candidatus Dormibacteraeota bacterium]|nr:class I SAM-dependent methyltransferase [Candidatus Dormibacteraeota bacterium]
MTLTPSEILGDDPLLHRDGGTPTSWRVAADLLELLNEVTSPGDTTLETGAGVSTILFAALGARHHCVCPDSDVVARITEYCRGKGVATDSITFVVDTSERALPAMALPPLDLVLIDGRHGFPAPQIDWFYTAAALKVGGLVIVDDIQLWACRLLRDFLAAEPEWELSSESPERWSAFRKVTEGDVQGKEWTQQVYGRDQMNALKRAQSFRRALGMLQRGQVGAIARILAARARRRLK